MKILTVFGTRPEAIKLAPVIQALLHAPKVESRVCVTGQHRTMLDQVLSLFKIKPDYDLNIMTMNQTLSGIIQMIMRGLNQILDQFPADWVIVQGDTNTTFGAALNAFYHKIPVAHVEAGLRTRNIYSPWPEEINRQLTSRIAALHFAPTDNAKNNLLAEGILTDHIVVTGNTGIDALLKIADLIKHDPVLVSQLKAAFPFIDEKKKMILVTLHRRENFDGGIAEVCEALLTLAKRDDVQFIFPVHLNPNVANIVKKMLDKQENIFLISPQPYLEFVYLMMQSYAVLTDSGGIQEEAPTLGKPVFVLRESTERTEGIQTTGVKLLGVAKEFIIENMHNLLDDASLYKKMSAISYLYGDGQAASRIAKTILHKN